MKQVIKFLEYLRYHIFWSIDFLKGQKIKNHYREIRFIIENYNKSETIRDFHLSKILKHATNTTRFYKQYRNVNCLEDFPIIDKNVIRAHSDSFESNLHKKKNNYSVTTSGSTGASLTVYQDKNKVLRNNTDTIFFSELAGFKIGYKLLYLRHWSANLKKPRLLKYIQNLREIEVVNLHHDEISKLISQIKKDSSNKGLLGYPSGFETICKYLEKINSKPVNGKTKSIIAIAETLNNYTSNAMQKYFGCPVYSRYSNTENGIIAQQTKYSKGNFVINWGSYFLEILKLNENLQAEENEVGRIVITDLFNYATPMIRYDTGDIGIIDYKTTPPTLKNIEGRKLDIIYNTNGKIVSSFIIINIANYKEISQSQLIQNNKKEYTLKLNVSEAFNQEKDMVNRFKKHLGTDAIIKIEYVNEIPTLASGKRRAVVNNYIK